MKVSKFHLLIITLLLPLMVCGQKNSTASSQIKCIAIDPGHGGKAPGTVYGQIYEKEINLKVALILGRLLEENFPEVKVIYTRRTDIDVDLAERGKIANKAGADLFVSIHVNAVAKNGNRSAHGASTYIMGVDKDNRNLNEVMRENDVIAMEDNYSTKYEGYVPGSTESFIIFSLMQYAGQEKSMQLAETIQQHYRTSTALVDRGAWQAPFLVLWKTAMPSVLTEIGFLSNDEDRAYITSDNGQRKIATALFNAISEYKSRVEGSGKALFIDDTVKTDSVVKSDGSQTDTTAKGGEQSKATTVTIDRQQSSTNHKTLYYVQICALRTATGDNDATFRSYRGKVRQYQTDKGGIKCLVGGTESLDECTALRNTARKEFKDAFIVEMKDDKIVRNIY